MSAARAFLTIMCGTYDLLFGFVRYSHIRLLSAAQKTNGNMIEVREQILRLFGRQCGLKEVRNEAGVRLERTERVVAAQSKARPRSVSRHEKVRVRTPPRQRTRSPLPSAPEVRETGGASSSKVSIEHIVGRMYKGAVCIACLPFGPAVWVSDSKTITDRNFIRHGGFFAVVRMEGSYITEPFPAMQMAFPHLEGGQFHLADIVPAMVNFLHQISWHHREARKNRGPHGCNLVFYCTEGKRLSVSAAILFLYFVCHRFCGGWMTLVDSILAINSKFGPLDAPVHSHFSCMDVIAQCCTMLDNVCTITQLPYQSHLLAIPVQMPSCD